MSGVPRPRAWPLAGGIAVAMGASIPISVAADNALLGALLVAWLAGGGPRRSWTALRASRFAQLALALFALLALGTAYADAPLDERFSYLWKYRELALVPVLVPAFAEPVVRRRALVVFCAAAVASVLISYLLYLGLVPGQGLFKGVPSDPYVFKLRITHSFLAAIAGFVLAAAALRAPRGWQRAALGLLALLCALNVLLLVQGRTGYLVLAGLIAYAFVARLGWKGAAAGAALVAALAAAAFYGSSAFHARVVETVAELRQARADPAAETSTGLRLQFLRTSLAIIRDHPLAGVGTGGFAAAYAEKVRGTALVPTRNPHSEYLLLGAQVGLAGPALLLALFWALWRECARLPAAALERELGQALVVAMALGCLVNAFFLDHTEGLVFAWLGALALGATRPAQASSTSATTPASQSMSSGAIT